MFYIYENFGNWTRADSIDIMLKAAKDNPIIQVHTEDLFHQIKGFALIQGMEVEVIIKNLDEQVPKEWNKINRDQVFTSAWHYPIQTTPSSRVISWR